MIRRVLPAWLVRDPRGRLKRLRLRVTVTRPRTALQKRRLTRSSSLSPADRALLRRTDSRIHPYEDMYTGDGSHYFSVALSAIRCIDAALIAAGASPPQRILDMPCGFGRVTRTLAARFPQAEITACDIRPRPVQFCAERFGARGVISSEEFDGVSFDRRFDLVWCGSLVTHLDARQTLSLIDLFERCTAAGALIIFTTGGEAVAEAIKAGSDYKLAPEGQRRAVSAYERDGFGYADYPGELGYGISLVSEAWIDEHVGRRAGLRQVYFEERGWDSHQDVYAFRRIDPATAAARNR